MDSLQLNLGSASRPIQYQVHRNAAASKNLGQDVFSARVVTSETVSLAEIAKTMVANGSPYGETHIVSVLTDMANTCTALLCGGRAVDLGGLVRLRPSIRGTFESEEATVGPGHTLRVKASVGSKLRGIVSGCATQKIVRPTVALAALDSVHNVLDGSPGTLCSKGLFFVQGRGLLWDNTKDDEGFVLNLLGVETKCPVVSGDPAGKALVLRTTQTMEVGDTPELWFYRRSNGGLYQFRFKGTLTCVAAPSA